jgi:thiol:disulfide interchange protein
MAWRFSLKTLLLAFALTAMLSLGLRQYHIAHRPIAWEPYTHALFERACEQERPILVNFVAYWDPMTSYHETVCLERPAVRKWIADAGALPLRADYTDLNKEVGEALKRIDGEGKVPVVAVYAAGNVAPPVVVLDLHTAYCVEVAIERAMAR